MMNFGMNNNNMGTMGANQMGGSYYTQPQQPKMSQPLTQEQINTLRSKAGAFSLRVSEEEFLASICTHRDKGQWAIGNENPDGTVTCSICGETFKLVDRDPMEIANITESMIDILQSIKTYYIDMPDEAAREFFRMIPLLRKVPKFFEMSLANFNKYNNNQMVNQSNNMYGFSMYSAMGTPTYGMMQQQPMNMNMGMQPNMNMGMGGMQQPMNNNYSGNPFYNNGMQQPMNNGYNNGMQQPMNGQPMNNGYNNGMQQPMNGQPNNGYNNGMQQPNNNQPNNNTQPNNAKVQQTITTTKVMDI